MRKESADRIAVARAWLLTHGGTEGRLFLRQADAWRVGSQRMCYRIQQELQRAVERGDSEAIRHLRALRDHYGNPMAET
jgi:hypothetical protein